MSEPFILDWRCISVGMPDLVAERQGITVRIRQGVWRDWDNRQVDSPSVSPCYRLVIDDASGQVLGGTLYGPEAGRCVEELRQMIATEPTEVALVGSGSE
ncbi:hypothetical protein LOC67_00800 [Stieleria sp. JC731]|uniref:hypothetical protein n=1 Tax=Pirellulaceae TaxID=2691357 RepID=UPI001E54AD54|nr:hypothetical protein [Stieleria sp. JC731]MCC9599080.1 hypothetical protein [Stieleria sp. JC731]